MEAKDQAKRLLAHLRSEGNKRPTERGRESALLPDELEALKRRADFMVDVWEKMGDIFGQLWENNFGNADGSGIQTWTAGLAHYSETSIRAAVDLMKAWPSKFPPTLGEFAEIARQYRPAIDPSRQLKHARRAPREVAERELAKMKAILRGEDPDATQAPTGGTT